MVTPGQQILASIFAEHEKVRGIMGALASLIDGVRRDDVELDAERLEELLEQAISLPKTSCCIEARLLYPLLRERCPALGPVLERLQAEHDRGHGMEEVREALAATREKRPLVGVISATRRYVDQRMGHLQVQEEYILPVAAHYLTPTDWSRLDAAWVGAHEVASTR